MNLPGDHRGFTLTELMIVVALTAILAAIAYPQMGSMINTYRLNGAARAVWSDLQNAKMTAIKTNQSITVTFDNTTTHSYPRPNDPRGPFTRNLANDYPGVTISYTGGSSLSFNSRGMVPVGDVGTVKVTLAGRTKKFTIQWTGRIGNISNET
ncbi:MAG TPA: prepilin-type N-terminal cleavage/methylation domain-containing protein [Proteobacteria bacterium]|nr:prepilin-type N-terminal cleavage/methylation domain-containing protein [Pseudomonadota bacterium]